MKGRSLACLAAAGLVAVLAGCADNKSSNPLSPTVAGPIPGVAISTPTLVQPSVGQRIAASDQPVTLVVGNSTTSGVRPLTYVFQVATDAGFTTVVFSKDGVQPGSGGQTTVKLSDALASGRTYYWRAQAVDGANSSAVPAGVNFDIYTPVVIGQPTPVSPVGGAKVSSIRPTLTVTDPSRSGPVGTITYNFQVSDTQTFAALPVNATAPEQSGQTSYAVGTDLAYSKTYYWRARASDPTTVGPWSTTQWFVTPDQASPGGGGGGGGGTGGSSGDGLTLSSAVIVVGPSNFASWSAASTISSVSTSSSQVCIYHSMLGQWPTVAFFGDPSTLVEGNQWYFAYINGRWYGGAGEWLRPGQACKGFGGGPNEFYDPSQEPLHSWIPQNGDQVGLADSTPARAWPNMSTLDQRTNIVVVSWKN